MSKELKRDKDGFRLRGADMSGIQAFTDAAFAFALSLLVISLSPPTSLDKLLAALHGVPSFIASGAMLMMFWWGHHVWCRRYGLEDFRTVMLSSALVFTVLIYVYPLRFVFNLLFEWIGQMSGLPLNTESTIKSITDVNNVFAVYGIGFAAMSGTLLLLYAHAWSQRDVLDLDAHERWETRGSVGAWLILTTVGVLSSIVAVAAPWQWVGAPGWVYACLSFIMPLYGRIMNRRKPAELIDSFRPIPDPSL